MYPHPSHDTQDDDPADDLRDLVPGQRPAADNAILDEPTSEVPVIRPAASILDDAPAGPSAAGDPDAPSDPDCPAAQADDDTAAARPDDTDPPAAQADDDTENPVQPPQAPFDTPDPTSPAPDRSAAPAGVDAARFPEPPAPAPTSPGAVASAQTSPAPPVQTSPAHTTPMPTSPARATGEPVDGSITLWPEPAAERFREQWQEVQGQFIDDPAAAVDAAKALVTEAVQQLADTLLEAQDGLDPSRGGEPADTEAMRLAMRRYREFLERVLAL